MNIKIPKLKFNNPINESKLDEIINLLQINSSGTIVDMGGGNGAVLLKMLQKSEAKGILIEQNKKLIEACKKESKSLVDAGKLILVEADAKTYLKNLKPKSVDCFVSIGSSYIFDGYLNFIKTILPFLKDGGFLLMGEEFWMKKPTKDYLKILGATESESRYHYQNIEAPEKMGLTYLYTHVASVDDWNRFEGNYFLEEEMKALELAEKERKLHLKKLRAFRKAQFQFGRSTMGFGLYLFMHRKQK